MNRLSELTILVLVCLAPWAYGSVEAWAELCLYCGIALLTVLGVGRCWRAGLRGRLFCLPSLALAGLVLLALVQVMPLGARTLGWLAPAAAARRAELLPVGPERVRGDAEPVVALPTTSLSLDPDSAIQMAARLAAAWLLFQAVLSLSGSPGALARLAWAVVGNAALLALFGIVQALTWNGCIYWFRPAPVASGWSAGGPFLSHNHLAAYLNMGLGLSIGLLLHGGGRDLLRRDSPKLWAAYAAAIITAGVITSHSRSAFVGLLVAGLVLAISLRSRLVHSWLGLIMVLATAGLFLALLAGPSSFSARLATILDPGDAGYQSRLEVWRGSLRAWWARPVWGSGLGSFPIAVMPHLRRNQAAFFARAENEYVDLIVEGGALGLLLALAFLAGVGRLARRAIRHVADERDRGLVWGAAFGLIALAVQSCADFGPHIPAIGVMAVVLCGQIVHLGQTADALDSRATNGPSRTGRTAASLAWLGSVVLSIVLVAHGFRDAQVEDRLTTAGLPSPGTRMATVGTNVVASWELEGWREALQAALQLRPNWGEGHVRLGLVHLGLYRLMAQEWLEEAGCDPAQVDPMADPLWLLGSVHAGLGSPSGLITAEDLLGYEPVHRHLVPAARCFLEARRCSPYWALPQAELASLDYLLVGGDSASVHAARALELAGSDGVLLLFLGEVAAQAGDPGLAARCWRRTLATEGTNWQEVADAAVMVLPPAGILSDVVSNGRDTIRFADRLYGGAEHRDVRGSFLLAALDRLDRDRGLTAAERLFLKGHALAVLDRPEPARQRIEAALSLQPDQSAWRQEYIDWLLHWGRLDEAHAQALSGLYLTPDTATFRTAVDRTVEALARGGLQY